MTDAYLKKALKDHETREAVAEINGDQNRARSVMVGTVFGGSTEIGMRTTTGSYVWCLLQPHESIEIIHQLAANIGCHINLQPRKDFGSWRSWNEDTPKSIEEGGDKPSLLTKAAHQKLPEMMESTRCDENEQTLAVEKPKNKRSVKRSTNSS